MKKRLYAVKITIPISKLILWNYYIFEKLSAIFLDLFDEGCCYANEKKNHTMLYIASSFKLLAIIKKFIRSYLD